MLNNRMGISWGPPLCIANQGLSYSLYPIRRTKNGLRPNPVLYTAKPWIAMRGALGSSVAADEQEAAMASLQQGEELFAAATSATATGAQAMLYYYSLFNVAKALMYARGVVQADQRIEHGLSAAKGYSAALDQPCQLSIHRDPGRVNAYARLELALAAAAVQTTVEVIDLARQCVIGHRLLSQALGEDERFIAVRGGQLEVGGKRVDEKELVFYVGVATEDLRRLGISGMDFAGRVGLPGQWLSRAAIDMRQRDAVVFYTERAPLDTEDDELVASMVEELVSHTRWAWHRVVTALPPTYRRYYLYDAPGSTPRIPQVLAAYALLFYFGSMNRYNPRKFRELLAGPCGPFVHEFLNGVPTQLLYLLASELCQQEIAHPSVVV